MPQEHITTVLTALFAPGEAATPMTNPMLVYGVVAVLFGGVALALWASRPLRRGLGPKPLTPRPDGADGLPWMPGGDIFGNADEPAPAIAATTRPAPTYRPAEPSPTYYPAPTYQPPPTYQPEPTYRPVSGAPQFNNPPAAQNPAAQNPPTPYAPRQPGPPEPRNPWSTG
jgi:hypothetical protein